MVSPAEIDSAASSHPPVCPCAISSPICWGAGWRVGGLGGDGTLATGGSIGSEARSEHASTPRTYVTHLDETSHMSAEFVFRYGPNCMGGLILTIPVLLHL